MTQVGGDFHDPVTINLRRQTQVLFEQIPTSPHRNLLQNPSTKHDLLSILSSLLAIPSLTIHTAIAFRPLLLDLCSRWLLDADRLDDKLEAFGLLLEIHPEIFPVFSAFLRQPEYSEGLLAFVFRFDSLHSIDVYRLQRILLVYYRILHANVDLPRDLHWPLEPLARLIWTPHPDNGVRFLAIRCYALHTGMIEGERVKVEKEMIGDVTNIDCPIAFGESLDGTRVVVDGWIMPMLEVTRIFDARNAHLEPQDYYVYENNDSTEPIHPAELSPNIVNVHGILMFRETKVTQPSSTLITTPTAVDALRALAAHLSLRVPTLLTSAPSAGKSTLLAHLALLLHPDVKNKIITIYLADTSLDPRSLLGAYVTSTTRPGTFEWKEGVLVRAMREGKWVIFKDIDRGSNEVLGLLKPLIESLCLDKWIGGRACLEVPGKGLIKAHESFMIFATRSLNPSPNGNFPPPTFHSSHKFSEVVIASPTHEDLRMIINGRFPRLAGVASEGLIRVWDAVSSLGSSASTRDVGLRELEKLCCRVNNVVPITHEAMDIDIEMAQSELLPAAFPNMTLREDIYFECRDVLFGSGGTTSSARAHLNAIAVVIADHLGLTPERRDWVLTGKIPEYHLVKDINGMVTSVRLGRTRLMADTTNSRIGPHMTRPFAMHKPAILLMSRIATAVSLGEPVLLTGETGTGKTSVVSHLASLLRKPLISLNLSNQTESSDIIGGFKPVDTRVPAAELQGRFLELFEGTFSRKKQKNVEFGEVVRKAVREGKWKRAVALWMESARLARERIRAKVAEDQTLPDQEDEAPRKRRKTGLNVSEANWEAFERDVRTFEIQHIQGNGKFAFGFVEGPLVKALRFGHWILLDEVNLASAETLECVAGLLQGPTTSITLTEQGSLEPVPRHPEFRLFACMNPATDVGKKDLPSNIRSRFSEIDVPPPDADKETLLSIVEQYIGPYTVGDRGAVMDVAEFYTEVRKLAGSRKIADGSNHRPHFSMRTLTRALTFVADVAGTYSLRRALWEGCLMAFTMILDKASSEFVTTLAQKHILSGVRNPRSLLAKDPTPPQHLDRFVKFGPFYLERGPLPEELVEDYIMTPSVEKKLIDLARITVTRRFPVLIEGPTSSGKTSSIEYLARRTGHRFVRINNHEHTDIQEYLGTYVSDPATGKLVFKDGLLVRALRNGDWIVLDELNLAPTDVLEALNRLLDDNRELIIPETQEVVRPHPHFLLFATQNPPGLYAGRKVLSRAFRNRFLEVHFEDVPQAELETILCQRCRIAPSYGKKIVAVFEELQRRRQSSRIFESKQGFATLRDLFRWAGRDAIDYQELADNGYMLLAERARRGEDKAVVKEVIESIMKVRIDEARLYNLFDTRRDPVAYLGCPLPSSSQLVWTSAMQRLFILLSRALRFKEPVLLVGETGCGKTSVCQVYAQTLSKELHTVSCHQNTETADLIGGLRPVRNRAANEEAVVQEAVAIFTALGVTNIRKDIDALTSSAETLLKAATLDEVVRGQLRQLRTKLQRLSTLFEWHDGPLINSMQNGGVFLLDEISLADDSVLERLNSVLEPSRMLVLAERGGDELTLPLIEATEDFTLVATMNPGGDYGKKELSPALRNRFTEIWVPPVDSRQDLRQIVESLWRHADLRAYTDLLLGFTQWLADRISDPSIISLRDILAWVEFSNAVYNPDTSEALPANQVFHHAAQMTFLDGLSSLPQLSAYSQAAIEKLSAEAYSRLHEIASLNTETESCPYYDPARFVQLGTFAIPKGPKASGQNLFSLQAPTTRDNVSRVVRGCQLPKPILLEGSPGVGKTSLVTALANICGFELCRINLSDQTDLVDLFGSDLPVEGDTPGQFAWKDAEFLRAMQEGHWVLLDEMNLAPQAILEGLNAVLDHRGSVFIPELGKTFSRHPSFRIFAAQNPIHQGGGRKGLPKSFMNRFTKVYVQELSKEDIFMICCNLFPEIEKQIWKAMIEYTTRLHEEVMTKRSFGRVGTPWEFNLRDLIRWGTLIRQSDSSAHPGQFLNAIFLQRFRVDPDRQHALRLFKGVFQDAPSSDIPRQTITPSFIQFGCYSATRDGFSIGKRPGRIFPGDIPSVESVGLCVANNWLTILTGPAGSGKTTLVRTLAHLNGRPLHELAISIATDASDILGSFEEVNALSRTVHIWDVVTALTSQLLASSDGSIICYQIPGLFRGIDTQNVEVSTSTLLRRVSEFVTEIRVKAALSPDQKMLLTQLEGLLDLPHHARFEWVDGPLVNALKYGHWLVLDGANLCSPSVLDRLNSLCEADGVLTLNERGPVNGQIEVLIPHPNFRLFMCVDTQFGELSRAMRNRGLEVALLPIRAEDQTNLLDFLRIPPAYSRCNFRIPVLSHRYELSRRGCTRTELGIAEDFSIPVAQLLNEDSGLDSLVTILPTCLSREPQQQIALSYFFTQSAPLAYLSSLKRFIFQLQSIHSEFVQLYPLVHNLSSSRVIILHERMRTILEQKRGIPTELLAAQPLDLRMRRVPFSVDNGELASQIGNMSTLLRLFVALQLSNETPVGETTIVLPTPQQPLPSAPQARVMKEVNLVIASVLDTARLLLDSIDIPTDNTEGDLDLMSRLTSLAQYLRKVSGKSPVNYSAIYVVAIWLVESLTEFHSPIFNDVHTCVAVFGETMTLTSGRGISEIWAAFSSTSNGVPNPTIVSRLEAIACGSQANVRRLSMEKMAVHTLPFSIEKNEFPLMSAMSEMHPNESGKPFGEDPFAVLAESLVLGKISVQQDTLGIVTLNLIQERLALAYEDSCGTIFRFTSYMHLVWAEQAAKPRLPSAVEVYRGWLGAIWMLPLVAGVQGPSQLFTPIQIYGAIQLCDLNGQTLLSLDSYSSSLRRRVRTIGMSLGGTSRMAQLTEMLVQATFMVSLPFLHASADRYMISPISTLPSSGEDSCEPVISRVMDVMEGSASTILVQSFQQNLRPLMYQLQNDILAGRDALVHLGHCWMGLSRMLLDLFVPSTPIDPASLQTTASEFWEEEKAIILSQLRYHQNLEVRVSGTTENEAIHHLTAMAEEIQVKLLQSPPKPSFPCKRDANQLHTYWSEVDQFLQHVLSPPRIAALISSMESEGYHATPREEVIQESIAAFCQRLSTAYPGFDDITKPLHLALLFFRFGLRLVTHALVNSRRETHADEMALASSLASFPSIQAVDLLCRGELKIDQSPSHAILAKLAALTFKVDQGLDISTRIQEVTQLYEQAIGLWLIDQTRREQSDLEAQSLYKGRSNTSTDHPDLDPEEEEFLSVFPQFEDLLSESSEGSLRQHTVLVTESLSSQISTLHGALFSVSGESTTHRPSESFTSIRYRLLAPLVETGFASWSETLDENSIPTQLDMLIHQIASLEGAHHATDQTYDFYHDVNIPEIKKGAAIVSQLCNRLRLLAIEWPEQMVLQHLITRCEGILKLRLGTPVAMVLCSLEQLLLQSEDWQTFANRENSIKDHQQSLVALIIEWRQLELSTWQGLLAREASTFANDISTWWFRLYEVTVRGVLDAAKGSDERRESLSHFLDELVPLLDSFLSRSPLGQFQSRLQLLRSFEMYLGLVTVAPSTIGTETFKRVHLILSSSRKYFAQFEAKTSTLLSQQLLNIERDIRDVIKLASWRDVNVHALRQSAQRSHRQLFKYIRKFREVLRQPVGPLLQLNLKMEDPRDPDEALVSIGFPLPSTPTFPERFHGSLPRHLVHLDQTYHNFCDVIKGKIVPTLDFSTSLSVESLSTEIITSSKHLSSIVVPTAGDTTKRVKLQKHLLTRKRKAWSDLLKELKRSGLSSNVKPEVLAQQQNIRWLREQPVLNFPPDDLSLEKAEGYFVRLLGGLPLLRASLPDHNPDLPTRDLQRGTMFLESAFALALRDRSSIATALPLLKSIQAFEQRLRALSSCPTIHLSGTVAVTFVSSTKETLRGLSGALHEVHCRMKELGVHLPTCDVPEHQIDELEASIRGLEEATTEVSVIEQNVKSTTFHILTQIEYTKVEVGLERVRQVEHALLRWSEQFPRLRQFYDPVQVWLSKRIHPQPLQPFRIPSSSNEDAMIQILLRTVQVLYDRHPASTNEDLEIDEPPDHYIRSGSNAMCSITSSLNLESISIALNETLQCASVLPEHDVRILVGRLLPFLQIYLSFASTQMLAHGKWLKSLLKLDFVLCSLLITLVKEGFCQPKEAEEGGTGEEMGEPVQGSGLGQGSGNENVSKDIQEESQVEGLEGEDADQDNEVERAEEGDAIEMSEDIGGKMQDVPDSQSDKAEGDDDESVFDPEDQVGQLDNLDETAIDEKLWGDEKGPQESGDTSKQSNKDHSKQPGETDVVAKEQQGDEGQRENSEQELSNDDVPMESLDEETTTDNPPADGLPMDEHIPDADTLDLPDNLDMDTGNDQDKPPAGEDDDLQLENEVDMDAEADSATHSVDGGENDQGVDGDAAPDTSEIAAEVNSESPQENAETAVAQADVHGGGDGGSSGGEVPRLAERMDHIASDDAQVPAEDNTGVAQEKSETSDNLGDKGDTGSNQMEPHQGDSPGTGSQTAERKHRTNQPNTEGSNQTTYSEPIRKLGDVMREVVQNFEEILGGNPEVEQGPVDTSAPSQLEYLQHDESIDDMQALGPAGQEEVAKLRELRLAENDGEDRDPGDASLMDIDEDLHVEPPGALPPLARLHNTEPTSKALEEIEGAVTSNEIRGKNPSTSNDATAPILPASEIMAVEEHESQVKIVETALRDWQATGHPSEDAEDIWRLYESLTHDLSYALCEQLRLILEPTLATRLKGDYRTGKRLNMKKIIPYIASEYTKDKIWLRRTRPSQREYQVLIALDDSRSMAESRSIHLAYQTLALVSKALSRLEVGDVAIAKFGEDVEVLHTFEGGPFTDQAGRRIIDAFRFDQKATQVLSLIDTSLVLLERAREQRAMSSNTASDLWQLEIIISDGICQDHERLNTVLRKAEEQRVMIVFIVLDSLHSSHDTSNTHKSKDSNSILSMNQVAYKEVDGRMDLVVSRYLDTFPFEYYVVVRDVESLPEILSSTLKQFFERITEE